MVSVRTRVGRPDLLELVGVAVEGEGGQGPEQAGAGPPVEREHRAGQLGPALHVEDAELGADLPVGHPLGLAVGGSRGRPDADDDVVLGAVAVGGVVGREVGEVEQRLAHRLLAASAAAWRGRAPRRRAAGSARSALGPASSPDRRASPTCLESAFTCARSSSRRPMAARASASSSTRRSTSRRIHPPAAERRLHPARSSRTSRISIMTAQR